MKKIIILIIVSVICTSYTSTGQDLMFSQFFNTPLLVNPAQTGLDDNFGRVEINYRNQWGSIMEHPFETFSLELEMKVNEGSHKAEPLVIGVLLMRDKAGASGFSTTNGMLSLRYMQQLNKHNFLGGGIQAGLGQCNLNYDNLFWGSQYNPATNSFDAALGTLEPHLNNSFNFFNVAGGLLYNYRTQNFRPFINQGFQLEVGASLNSRFMPQNSFYNYDDADIYTRFVVHTAAFIGTQQKKLALIPRIIYVHLNPVESIIAGTSLRYKAQEDGAAFNIGFYYRLDDVFIPCVGLEFNNLRLNMAYDFNAGDLGKHVNQAGGIEINLSYSIP